MKLFFKTSINVISYIILTKLLLKILKFRIILNFVSLKISNFGSVKLHNFELRWPINNDLITVYG